MARGKISTKTAIPATSYAKFLSDPYPVYANLRTNQPVFWNEARKAWVVACYQDITDIEKNPHISHGQRCRDLFDSVSDDRKSKIPTICRTIPMHLGHLDGAIHRSHRKLFDAAVSSARLKTLLPMIGNMVDRRLNLIGQKRQFDLIEDFAKPLPLDVMTRAMGLDPSHNNKLLVQLEDMLGAFDPRKDSDEDLIRKEVAVSALVDTFRCKLQGLTEEPEDNILNDLVLAWKSSDLDIDDAICIGLQGLTGSYESLRHAIGLGFYAAVSNPEWVEDVMNEDGLPPFAVDELLRFDPMVQRLTRTASKPVNVRGQTIATGERIQLLLGSGNRDPRTFSAPEFLSTNGRQVPHLTFGIGPHYCPGARLARIVLQVTLSRLLQRTNTWIVDTDAVEWDADERQRGLISWQIRLRTEAS